MKDPKKHILIADSDEQALIALEHLLEDEGFETTTAWSTNQVVDLIERGRFDLLLVADHPPEVNCELLLRRTKGKNAATPLVVMENRPRHPFAEPYLLTLGAREIVHKWQYEEVKHAVSGMLAPASGMASKRAVAGALNLG